MVLSRYGTMTISADESCETKLNICHKTETVSWKMPKKKKKKKAIELNAFAQTGNDSP